MSTEEHKMILSIGLGIVIRGLIYQVPVQSVWFSAFSRKVHWCYYYYYYYYSSSQGRRSLRLTVDIPTKAERQWPAWEDHRVALATS